MGSCLLKSQHEAAIGDDAIAQREEELVHISERVAIEKWIRHPTLGEHDHSPKEVEAT